MVEARRTQHRPRSCHPSLTRFFYQSLSDAARNRHLAAHDGTMLYVAELLTDYGDPRRLFDYDGERIHLPALADLYLHAVESESRGQRKAFLQRLGDVALFVAGLFPGYLERRVVGVDYYIAMGQSAYGYLEHDLPTGRDGGAVHSPFSELAAGFRGFVGLLREFGRRGDDAAEELEERCTPPSEGLVTPAPAAVLPPLRH